MNGEPKKGFVQKDKLSEKVILGDDFIEYCLEDKNFINYVKKTKEWPSLVMATRRIV